MSIDVERYPRTMIAKPMSASSFVPKIKENEEDPGEGPSETAPVDKVGLSGSKYQAVRMERAYLVDDEEAEGGKKEVERDELEKGYLYGRSVVPISSTDESITTLETQPSLQILGFVPRQGVSIAIIPDK